MMVRATDGGVDIDVLVTPRVSRTKIGPAHGGRLKVAVTAAPTDGAANRDVIRLVAKAVGVPASTVSVYRGVTSRRKTLRIVGITSDDAIRMLCLE